MLLGYDDTPEALLDDKTYTLSEVISTALMRGAWTERRTHPVGAPWRSTPISKATSVVRASSLNAFTVIASESEEPISPASRDTRVTP